MTTSHNSDTAIPMFHGSSILAIHCEHLTTKNMYPNPSVVCVSVWLCLCSNARSHSVNQEMFNDHSATLNHSLSHVWHWLIDMQYTTDSQNTGLIVGLLVTVLWYSMHDSVNQETFNNRSATLNHSVTQPHLTLTDWHAIYNKLSKQFTHSWFICDHALIQYAQLWTEHFLH